MFLLRIALVIACTNNFVFGADQKVSRVKQNESVGQKLAILNIDFPSFLSLTPEQVATWKVIGSSSDYQHPEKDIQEARRFLSTWMLNNQDFLTRTRVTMDKVVMMNETVKGEFTAAQKQAELQRKLDAKKRELAAKRQRR